MKLSSFFLMLFLICSILCVVGFIVDSETLFLVAKTMIFPIIIFYYFDLTKQENYLFVVSLFLFYLSDVLIILDVKYMNLILAIALNISHFILLYLSIQDIDKTKKNTITIWQSVLVFFVVQTLHWPIFYYINKTNFVLAISIFLSAIVVSIICAVGFYNFKTNRSKANLYFLLTCICFVFMYLSYEIYKFIYFISFLKYFSLINKLATYFFSVQYMIHREKFKNIEDTLTIEN